ncbi:MAG TPA: serine/threonine-protein kinase [Ktedonobacteraceae bacterium]|nr:serine/threonine-protein kinase [Ktedonobacteraceae bacterium]
MRRCADLVDCGFDNRDSDRFCRACALPLLNTALAGRYLIHGLISKGGYAAVFRGIDQHLSRRIAIKVLLPSKTSPKEQEHFLREARIAATLDHPNIAPILDYGQDGPSVFLVMPLYTSGSLRNRLASASGPLPAPETIYNFQQLGNALHYAHTRPRPVIHRDIKPENILIHQEDGRLMITDFGIARRLEPGARVGKTVTVRGTVGYMAPEQTSGIVDPRSDEYSSAIVLYEMLTGYHPLDPLGHAIPAPSSLNPELPSGMDEVVLRALAPRPEDRFPTLLEFMQAFDQVCRPDILMQTPLVSGGTDVVAAPRPNTNPGLAAVQPQTRDGGHDAVRGGSTGRVPAVRLNTASVREKCAEGDQLLRQQQYAQALQAYEEALRMDPRNFHAWNGKGTALYSQGNYKKAFEAYQRATEIDPDNPVVWVSAGLSLNRLQRYQQAIVHFDRAISLDPHYVPAWTGKADAQLDMNQPEEALASYEQALTYDSRSFQAWNGLGNARSSLRDFAQAVDAYTQALQVNPRSAVAWCNKAEALIQQGNYRAALDALQEATELDRSYARGWTLKADVYDALGNQQEAQKARRRVRPWGLMS